MTEVDKNFIGIKIAFFGNDLKLFSTIQKKFTETYTDEKFKFFQFFERSNQAIQNLQLEVIREKFGIIYIDLSNFPDEHLRLALSLRRDNFTKHIPIVGLVDYLDADTLLPRAHDIRIHLSYVKSDEIDDFIYGPMSIAFPDKVKEPVLATARVDQEFEFLQSFRIGYSTPEYLYAEGECYFKDGEEVQLITNLPKNILASDRFKVTTITHQNLYYDFSKGFFLHFTYPPDEVETEENKERLKKRQFLSSSEAKENFKKWFEEKFSESKPKLTKLLIIDKELNIIKQSKDGLDSLPFSIRTQTFLIDPLNELLRVMPQLIAIQLDDEILEAQPIVEEKSEPNSKAKEKVQTVVVKNDSKALTNMVDAIKKINGYNPFILVFNSVKIPTTDIKQITQYPLILATKDKMHLDYVVNLATVFQDKNYKKETALLQEKLDKLIKQNPVKNRSLTLASLAEKKIFFSKKTTLSYGSFPFFVKYLEITESSIVVQSSKKLNMYDDFFVFKPIKLMVTVIPHKKGSVYAGKDGVYRCLIHAIGELERKALRIFVNQQLGKSKEEERRKEKEEFAKLNKAAEIKKANSNNSDEEE